MATRKEELHRLVDQLPDAETDAAKRYLEYLRGVSDPLLRRLLEASEDDGELLPEFAAELEEARQEALRGEGRPWEEVRRELEE